MFNEGLGNTGQKILRSINRHKGNYFFAAVLTASAIGIAINDASSSEPSIFAIPGKCSEVVTPNIPLPQISRGPRRYRADNTNGGLLDAPVRSLFATPDGILVGHASASAPDSENPKSPVRLLTPTGWEICNSKTPIKGSVNAVFQNPDTKEIIVVKDTDEKTPGDVVDIFDGKRWLHFKGIPGLLDYRGYAAIANGQQTRIGTHDGITVWEEDKAWHRHVTERDAHEPIDAMLDTLDTRVPTRLWLGTISDGIIFDSEKPSIVEQVGIPKNVRALFESTDRSNRKKLWVGGDPGLGYLDEADGFKWNPVALPRGAKRVMAIVGNPYSGQPCVGTLDDGVFCWNGTEFRGIVGAEPATLSLAFGLKGSGFDGQMFVGTQSNGLIQLPAPR